MAHTTVHAFVQAINHQSPDQIAAMMTEDHVFIDGLGNRVAGRDQMKKGWAGYFKMVPDYTITVEESFGEGPVVVMTGTAQGTYAPDGSMKKENAWQTPAAWRAVVRGEQNAEWRVYADNEPIRKLMSRPR